MNKLVYKVKQLILVVAALICRNFFKIFYIFSIEEQKILFCSHQGSGYTCNPKYIYICILKINLQMNLNIFGHLTNRGNFFTWKIMKQQY